MSTDSTSLEDAARAIANTWEAPVFTDQVPVDLDPMRLTNPYLVAYAWYILARLAPWKRGFTKAQTRSLNALWTAPAPSLNSEFDDSLGEFENQFLQFSETLSLWDQRIIWEIGFSLLGAYSAAMMQMCEGKTRWYTEGDVRWFMPAIDIVAARAKKALDRFYEQATTKLPGVSPEVFIQRWKDAFAGQATDVLSQRVGESGSAASTSILESWTSHVTKKDAVQSSQSSVVGSQGQSDAGGTSVGTNSYVDLPGRTLVDIDREGALITEFKAKLEGLTSIKEASITLGGSTQDIGSAL